MTTGTTYKFKVQARNEYGISDDSDEIFVLVAQIPDEPTNIVTTISGAKVQITWTPGSDHGSTLLGY